MVRQASIRATCAGRRDTPLGFFKVARVAVELIAPLPKQHGAVANLRHHPPESGPTG